MYSFFVFFPLFLGKFYFLRFVLYYTCVLHLESPFWPLNIVFQTKVGYFYCLSSAF